MRIESYDFEPGRVLARKYEVVSQVGRGWEGEVYMLNERDTGIERAAKFFFPQRNPGGKTSVGYAQKLHKLRNCQVVTQYHTQETISFRGQPVTFLVSDFVEGELLSEFIDRQPGKRLSFFEGLHLLHALARGVQEIHDLQEYHGDIHSENIFVRRAGLHFQVKLIDMYQWDGTTAENVEEDVCNLIRVFYDAIGGAKFYAKLPAAAKDICCGLRRSLILKKFRTAGELRLFLEKLDWT